MHLLLVDNYDSFTYNLFQLLSEAGCSHIDVIKNDAISLAKVRNYSKIVFSPGPGVPSDVPILHQIIEEYQQTKSILGVCLGHQAIGEFYGATLQNIAKPFHGIASKLHINDKNESLFHDIHEDIMVGRYHSWVVSTENFPDCLQITSKTEDGTIMSIVHNRYDVKGIQFHPESYITQSGMRMMRNWLNL